MSSDSPSQPVRLHGYFRSSASWRVRIALHLKGIAFEEIGVSLLNGDQQSPAYLALNPQGLVPALEIDGLVLTQSLAICEYLDETRAEPPLLPRDAAGRARVRALAQAIACDVHPVQNLGVLRALKALGEPQEVVSGWAQRVCEQGLDAFAAMVAGETGRFCVGDASTLADVLLVPQMANARRYGAHMRWERLLAIEAAALALPAFAETAPERQPDYEV